MDVTTADPNINDSDGDGMSDSTETANGTNPYDASPTPV